MWITISGFSYEGDCAYTMRWHKSRTAAREWVSSNKRIGDYTKLMRRQPDGSFKFIDNI
jgi:hypothetical protein